ncbi:MAG: DUF2268 domain-containing putative Zn-dependent protease [Bacteroidota bacterium]
MKTLLTFFSVVILFTCKAAVNNTENISPPYFKIILLSDYYRDYLEAVRHDFANRDKIYAEKTRNPILKNNFAKSEYFEIVAESFLNAPDTIQLAKSLLEIEFNRKTIEEVISAALIKCNQYLKNDSLTFYIIPSTNGMKQIMQMMGGVSGLTAGSKQILLTIDPEDNSWKDALPAAVAHEFNHTYWTHTSLNTAYKWTLLRYMVFEGKADAFAHFLYPHAKSPWTTSLNEKQKTELWDRIKPLLSSEDPSVLTEVMFGSQKYPLWGGYAIGYDIVRSAFENKSELTPKERTDMDAEKILGISKYK